jgi:hypoxanthine phosphoribosyltransferase
MGRLSDDGGIGDVMISEADLAQRVAQLGEEITAAYEGKAPLLICVLKGAYVFATDLARAVDLPIEIDFIALSSYGSSTQTSGVVRLVKDLDSDIAGRDVVLVEDIIDSGLTLRYLRRSLEARNPASLEVVSLLARERADLESLRVRWWGFRIPDDFVIGYGLDVDQRYRNLRYLARYEASRDPLRQGGDRVSAR